MRQTERSSKHESLKLLVVGAACLLVVLLALADHARSAAQGNSYSATDNEAQRQAASRAFTEAAKVLLSPRCVNCHPAGDAPLQGDDSVVHAQGVLRGPDGKGVPGMKCNSCHQQENLAGEHMPPGGPNWHLPPPSMPMVFEKRTPGQLCRQLKDPKQNGGKKVEEMLEHARSEPLVLWGWNPGEGRAVPPLTHAEFVQNMVEWIRNGAACPD